MSYYWAEFNGRSSGTIQAESPEDAKTVAAAFGDVKQIRRLPYPAEPVLSPGVKCPSFCYSPLSCAGRSCCPKNYACSN